ncbi:Piso0_001839 [Millerozyma farinosa CBS 7064]|uniref:Piso0_001839 protein n=1 Tax=Pichia sorbitophila (strain ATCC MYA-4447 / BCRC 22081 / CBS 7064 / NBRC 10061 / NRRL Y-12695) TaxID=559304 RepID=G8YLV7_PICSO|nr:Piso0_001839 [Millerozyma farinosa CBS 7064]
MYISSFTFEKHNCIEKGEFERLLKIFKGIDSSISVYYGSHTSPPGLSGILRSTSSLMGSGVKYEDVSKLLAIYPGCYNLQVNHGSNIEDEFTISFGFSTEDEKISVLRDRETAFIEKANSWIKDNQDKYVVPSLPIEDFVEVDRTKSSYIKSSTKDDSIFKELKNSSDKFRFKMKHEREVQSSNNGLSLLQRIKLKERARKEADKFDQTQIKRNKFIKNKLKSIYDILYHVHEDQSPGKLKSYSMPKLIATIKDSSTHPIHEDEAQDVVKALTSILGRNRMEIVSRNGITALKIIALDRSQDLKVLEND